MAKMHTRMSIMQELWLVKGVIKCMGGSKCLRTLNELTLGPA